MKVEPFAFYTAVTTTQYWLLAPITNFIINSLIFIEDQRMLGEIFLMLHLYHMHKQHPICLEMKFIEQGWVLSGTN